MSDDDEGDVEEVPGGSRLISLFIFLRAPLKSRVRVRGRGRGRGRVSASEEVTSSEAGCGTLRGGMDAEFVTSDRFIPWCVELGFLSWLPRSRGKGKHPICHRFVTEVWYRHERY